MGNKPDLTEQVSEQVSAELAKLAELTGDEQLAYACKKIRDSRPESEAEYIESVATEKNKYASLDREQLATLAAEWKCNLWIAFKEITELLREQESTRDLAIQERNEKLWSAVKATVANKEKGEAFSDELTKAVHRVLQDFPAFNELPGRARNSAVASQIMELIEQDTESAADNPKSVDWKFPRKNRAGDPYSEYYIQEAVRTILGK